MDGDMGGGSGSGTTADGPGVSKQGGMGGGMNAWKGRQSLAGAVKMYQQVEEVVEEIVGGARDAAGALKDGEKALGKMMDLLGAPGAMQQFKPAPLSPGDQVQQVTQESLSNKDATAMGSINSGKN